MANRDNQPPSGNPFRNLRLDGTDRPPQAAQAASARQSAPLQGPSSENPFLTMDVGGFAPVGSAARPPQASLPQFTPSGIRPRPIPPPTTSLLGRDPRTPMPVTDAVDRLRDPSNLEPGARQPDGSVRITREWVTRVVGIGHMERSPRTRVEVFARHSALRNLGPARLGLPERFVQWMSNENGSQELQIPPNAARQFFRW